MEARRTGLFCAVQEDALPQIDLVGNNFDIYQDYEILSHKVKQVAAESIVDLTAQAGIVSVAGSTLTIQGNDPALSAANLSSLHGITDSKYLEAYVGGEYVKIESITNTGSGANGEGQVTIVASGAISKSYEKYNPGTPAPWASNANFIVNEDGNIVVDATPTSYESIVVGNFLESVNAGEYVAISNVSVEDGELTISCAGGLSFSTQYGGVGNSLTAFFAGINTSFDVWTLTPNARAEMFPTLSEGWTFTDNGAGIFTLSGSNDATWNSDIKVGMYVPGDGGKLSRIKKIVKTVVNGTTYYRFETHRAVSSRPSYSLKRYEDAGGFYKTFPLEGATQTAKSIAELLSAIKPGTGLGNALVDKDNITFRYVVDTFGSLENGGILNKEELSFLCKERQNASAILNAPMVKELKASTNPSFLNAITGAVDVNNVSTGGN